VADKARIRAQACQGRGKGTGRSGPGTGARGSGSVRLSGRPLPIIRCKESQ
jgi:hypothetical protein